MTNVCDFLPVSRVLTITRSREGVRLYCDLNRTTMTPAEALTLAAGLAEASDQPKLAAALRTAAKG